MAMLTSPVQRLLHVMVDRVAATPYAEAGASLGDESAVGTAAAAEKAKSFGEC